MFQTLNRKRLNDSVKWTLFLRNDTRNNIFHVLSATWKNERRWTFLTEYLTGNFRRALVNRVKSHRKNVPSISLWFVIAPICKFFLISVPQVPLFTQLERHRRLSPDTSFDSCAHNAIFRRFIRHHKTLAFPVINSHGLIHRESKRGIETREAEDLPLCFYCSV